MKDELFWLQVSALGQVAGAFATFLAVVTSLYIALHGRKPRLRVVVGERMILGGHEHGGKLLTFSVANQGERPVHVSGLGWRTGWLSFGPRFLRRQYAVQLTGGIGLGSDPPYQIEAGAAVSSYAVMSNVLEATRKRKGRPFFTRDWPGLGRRNTAVWGYAYTADGHTIHVRAEKALVEVLAEAERAALAEAEPPDA